MNNVEPGKYLVRDRVSGNIYEMEFVETKLLKFWKLDGTPLGTQPQDEDVVEKICEG